MHQSTIGTLQCHWDHRVENHLAQDGHHGPRVRRQLLAAFGIRLGSKAQGAVLVTEEVCTKVVCRFFHAIHGESNLWALKFIEEALSMLHGNNEVINIDYYVFPDVPGITHPNFWVSFGFLEPELLNDRGESLMKLQPTGALSIKRFVNDKSMPGKMSKLWSSDEIHFFLCVGLEVSVSNVTLHQF